uniref:Uncharacterized protein n=1 Tax=Salmo trutta TaxID=8032 RepID=A0A673XJB7_SALTR
MQCLRPQCHSGSGSLLKLYVFFHPKLGCLSVYMTDSLYDSAELVREFVAQNNSTQIRHVIQILATDFALSQHPHSRKGERISMCLHPCDSGLYLKELIEPVLTCFNDSDCGTMPVFYRL